MNIVINFLDNKISFIDDAISTIEIVNKNYFYRIVKILNDYSQNKISNEIYVCNNLGEEINLTNKISIFFDYFNFNINSKRNISNLNKYIQASFDNSDQEKLNRIFNNFINELKRVVESKDISLDINYGIEFNLENILKLLDLNIQEKNDILSNLLLLIDLEHTLKINELLIFINLKDYLSDTELNELIKYSMYNNVKILLIDSKITKNKLKNEKKLVIDDNLEEFIV
jgi:CRISPR type II-A-associated protein Csn2